MSGNGGRVKTREFYEALRDMDGRINRRLDTLIKGQAIVTTKVSANEKRLDRHDINIDELQKSDRKWAALSGFIAAVTGTIAGFLGKN